MQARTAAAVRSRPAPSSAIRAAIPSARSARGERTAPGALFTPAEGIPAAETMSVLVVDGDPGRREVLTASLSASGATTLVEAASAAEARERLGAGPACDLAVVDLGLPGGGALELVEELRARGWRTVVLGGADDTGAAQAAFHAGALAYLLTSSSAAGPQVPGQAVTRPDQDAESTVRDLSDREVQVLRCVADGRSNAEIGQELALSPLTVKSHLSRIGRKLGTGDRAHMVALAMSAGAVG